MRWPDGRADLDTRAGRTAARVREAVWPAMRLRRSLAEGPRASVCACWPKGRERLYVLAGRRAASVYMSFWPKGRKL